MVIAGAEVGIVAQLSVLTAHDQERLGVHLVTDDAIYHVRADLLEFGGPADVGFFVKACHQFHYYRHCLAILRGADERFHQYRIGAGAVHRHLDGDHAGVDGGLAEQVDDRDERLVWMVQQDVATADAGENVASLAQVFRNAGQERGKFHVRTVHPVRDLHQADQVDRAIDPVKVDLLQPELGEQEIGDGWGTVVGDFKPYGITKMALGQFPLQFGAQIGDFLFIDEQVGVAGGAELVAAQHAHADKQLVDELVQDGRKKNKSVSTAGKFLRQLDDSRQDARRLDDGDLGAAAEGILAFQFHSKIKTLVEYAREGVRRIESDRGQDRHHFALEKIAYPLPLHIIP